MQPTPGSQLALFATYSYHGFSTDRDGETLELEADRRRHAEIENAIRDLKYGVGLNHLPSGRFAANGAWLAVQAMAHNLARWTARIDLGEQIVTTTCYPSYPSLEQFYDWRGGRHSGEADYGWFNWDDAITPDPGESQAHQGRLRVVLVHDTGDLYAVDNIGQGPVLLLGTFQQHRSREQVEQRLANWAEGDGPGRPLSRFRERIASLNAQRPERSGEEDTGEDGPAFCHCVPEQVGGCQCFNTGYARARRNWCPISGTARPLGRLPDTAGFCRVGRLPRHPTSPPGSPTTTPRVIWTGRLTWPPGWSTGPLRTTRPARKDLAAAWPAG